VLINLITIGLIQTERRCAGLFTGQKEKQVISALQPFLNCLMPGKFHSNIQNSWGVIIALTQHTTHPRHH